MMMMTGNHHFRLSPGHGNNVAIIRRHFKIPVYLETHTRAGSLKLCPEFRSQICTCVMNSLGAWTPGEVLRVWRLMTRVNSALRTIGQITAVAFYTFPFCSFYHPISSSSPVFLQFTILHLTATLTLHPRSPSPSSAFHCSSFSCILFSSFITITTTRIVWHFLCYLVHVLFFSIFSPFQLRLFIYFTSELCENKKHFYRDILISPQFSCLLYLPFQGSNPPTKLAYKFVVSEEVCPLITWSFGLASWCAHCALWTSGCKS